MLVERVPGLLMAASDVVTVGDEQWALGSVNDETGAGREALVVEQHHDQQRLDRFLA